MYREKNIISGKMFEAEIYPVFAGTVQTQEEKRGTSEAQKKLNEKNARLRIIRLCNANFNENDNAIHGTFRDDEMPETYEETKKEAVNYLRRLKRMWVNSGRDGKLFKSIYVIEAKHSKKTGILRWHFHMIISGGLDRTEVEKAWGHGDWCNARRLQPNEYGIADLANYLSKDPQGNKRWARSQNLVEPVTSKPKPIDVSRSEAARIAQERVDDSAYWEQRYPGYRFVRCTPAWNDFNKHWYISVVMRERDNPIVDKKTRMNGKKYGDKVDELLAECRKPVHRKE